MTDAEEKELAEASARLAASRAVTGRAPLCVREALLARPNIVGIWPLRPVTLRMRLQLEERHEAVLEDRWPENPEDLLNTLVEVLTLLSGSSVSLKDVVSYVRPDELERLVTGINNHLKAAFSTLLKMSDPKADLATRPPGGFGWLLPLYLRLREDIGMTHDEALDTSLAEAFALRACSQWSSGWEPDGMTYVEREAFEEHSQVEVVL